MTRSIRLSAYEAMSRMLIDLIRRSGHSPYTQNELIRAAKLAGCTPSQARAALDRAHLAGLIGFREHRGQLVAYWVGGAVGEER